MAFKFLVIKRFEEYLSTGDDALLSINGGTNATAAWILAGVIFGIFVLDFVFIGVLLSVIVA